MASEPAFFAEVVSHPYKPDPPIAAAECSEDEYQFSEACWHLIRERREPFRALSMAARRTRTRCIDGYSRVEDGAWPCLAVRTILEREQDDVLEDELAVARINQRGVTTRRVHDDGTQERKLAEKYRKTADRLRDTWPRAGKVRDRIVSWYEGDAGRHDASAERQAGR